MAGDAFAVRQRGLERRRAARAIADDVFRCSKAFAARKSRVLHGAHPFAEIRTTFTGAGRPSPQKNRVSHHAHRVAANTDDIRRLQEGPDFSQAPCAPRGLAAILFVAVAGSPMVRLFGDEPRDLNTWVLFFPYPWLPVILVTVAISRHILVTRKLFR